MIRFLLLVFTILLFDQFLTKAAIGHHFPRPVIFVVSSLTDTLQVKKLLDSARSKTNRGDVDSAQYYLQQAGSLSKKLSFIPGYFEYAGEYARFLYRELRF